MVTTQNAKNIDGLKRRIGQRGDALFNGKLSDRYPRERWDVGFYHEGPPWWSICYRFLYKSPQANKTEPADDVEALTYCTLGWIDALHWLVRLIIFPFSWIVWWCERRWARWRKYSYFCPVCHNPARDPLVYCPRCGQIQGLLRPRVGELFVHRCTNCGESRWKIHGQYLGSPPHHLVCRNTLTTAGCTRPNPIASLLRKTRSDHLAILGVGTRTKHALFAHIIGHAAKKRLGRRGRCRIPWPVNRDEWQLARRTLGNNLAVDTDGYETPGRNYTLARTFLLRARSRLVVLHNLADQWLTAEAALAVHGYPLVTSKTWIFVLDAVELEQHAPESRSSSVETLSRLIRVVQKFRKLDPQKALPAKLAVVLPIPDSSKLWNEGLLVDRLEPETVRSLVHERAAAFSLLATSVFRRSRLRYFGGPLPDSLDLQQTSWLQEVFNWAL